MNNKNTNKNYLELKPAVSDKISWFEENDKVTISIENKGVFNKLAQLLLNKPRVSYVHLDEFGSFVLKEIDGEKTITEIGILVEKHFGEKSHPLYERLAKFISILESYGFIVCK